MLQKTKELNVKIEILDSHDVIIDSIEGITIDGSMDISNNGLIRRSLSMTFIANNKTQITKDSPLWINKRIKVYIGIRNYDDTIEYFNCGIFIISNPEKSITADGDKISIKGYDKMYLYQKPFENPTLFEVDTPIVEVVKGIGLLVGENKFIFDNINYLLTYKIQYKPDDKLENAIKDMTDMYMDYQIYYNADGYLVYEKTKVRLNDPIIWSFSEGTDFHINKTLEYNYDNIKNYIKVIGNLNDETNIQPKYEVSVTGIENVYSIDNIGKKSAVFVMDKYYTEEQCKQKANFELERSQNLANTITINTMPIYLINDVNKIIEVYDYNNNLLEKYLIDAISIPLNIEGQMSIKGHKLFN